MMLLNIASHVLVFFVGFVGASLAVEGIFRCVWAIQVRRADESRLIQENDFVIFEGERFMVESIEYSMNMLWITRPNYKCLVGRNEIKYLPNDLAFRSWIK